MATVRRLQARLEGKDAGATALLGKVKGAIVGLGATAAAVGGIQLAKKLVGGLQKATAAAGVQEAAEVKLSKALALAGQNASEALPDLKAFASSLQDLTGAGDEATLASQALLVSVGKLSGETLKEATVASLDLSAALGIDQRTAFDLVAKAASGYTGTLSRYGLILDESIPESKKFEAVLALINKQFGGQAESQLSTYVGRVREFEGRIGDLQEAIGGPFREATVIALGQGLSPFIKALTDFASGGRGFRDAVLLSGEAVARFADVVTRAARPILNFAVVLGLVALNKFVNDLKLATGILGGLAEFVKPGERTLFTDIADELNRLRSQGPDTLDNLFVGPIQETTKLTELLKAVGITIEEDLVGKGNQLREIFLALSDPDTTSFLTPEQYEIVRDKIEEIAVALQAEGGVVPGWVRATGEVISMQEAVQTLADVGIVGLADRLDEANAKIATMNQEITASLKQVGVNAASRFGTALVDAADSGSKAFGEFFKQLLRDLAAAIARAIILKIIVESTRAFGGGASSGVGLSQGGFVSATSLGVREGLASGAYGLPGKGAGVAFGADGLVVPGSDVGRDRVPAMLRPGELVFPRELADFLLSSASGGKGGSQVIELRSDIPLVVERMNEGVRQGNLRVVATRLSTTRGVR